MLRLVINPFEEEPSLAIFEGTTLKSKSSTNRPQPSPQNAPPKDKPSALEQAFRTLPAAPIQEIILLNGPGNFTTLRVALGFARGLALGLNIPTRGIGVFEVDHALIPSPPPQTTLHRDARGGRYYSAQFQNSEIQNITLTTQITQGSYSAEALKGTFPIPTSPELILQTLAQLAENGQGQIPAHANYVRPADAALPHEPPLKILDA